MPETDGAEEPDIDPIPIQINEENAEEIWEKICESEEKGNSSFTWAVGNKKIDVLIAEELKKAVKSLIPKKKQEALGLIPASNVEQVNFIDGVKKELVRPSKFSVNRPDSLATEIILKDYQEYGYGWLNWLKEEEISGGLLADDMGMGKTAQLAAFLAKLKDNKMLKPSLLILPPVLVDNWRQELAKFVPEASYWELKGAISEEQIDEFHNYEVLAITYHALTSKTQTLLGKIKFKAIICDEAQFIKNPCTARAKSVLSMQGDFKIATTATPIENTVSELWSILDFSNAGYLPPLREFNRYYGQLTDENRVLELKKLLEPIVLRRTKKEYLTDLPSKSIRTEKCIIDEIQKSLYLKVMEEYKNGGKITNFLHFIQIAIMTLSIPELVSDQFGIFFPEEYRSSKVLKLLELLREIKSRNEKVLIFSDRISAQTYLQDIIEVEFGVRPEKINSKTSQAKRAKIIHPFGPENLTKEFEIVILSPKCAGVGLNLVAANNVIHFMRGFNPAVENQATDRVYRIGQKIDVNVFNLISSSNDDGLSYTAEEVLDDLIQKKNSLLDDYLTAAKGSRISGDEFGREMGFGGTGLSIEDVDQLPPRNFEVFTEKLFSEMGYMAETTPQSGDFGADVVAVGNASLENALVQCKHKKNPRKSKLGPQGINEIKTAQMHYQKEQDISFSRLVVLTNGFFSEAAMSLAHSNSIELIDRNELKKLLVEFKVEPQAFDQAT